MMEYIIPIHHRDAHTIYNQNTLHLIDQCDVVMAADGHFEYTNDVIKFSENLFKNCIFEIHGD